MQNCHVASLSLVDTSRSYKVNVILPYFIIKFTCIGRVHVAGLVYCMEFLEANVAWLEEQLKPLDGSLC